MDENILKLHDNIMSCLKELEDINLVLKGIKGSTLFIGSGGSRVVAEYAKKVLEVKNELYGQVLDVRDINYVDLKHFRNILIASYSGTNYGVKKALDTELQKYILTTNNEVINDEILINYQMMKEKSFISLNATLVPMAVMLYYYLGEEIYEELDKMFKLVDREIYLESNKFINIFGGRDTKVIETMLNSTLIEAGIAPVVSHTKYDYCHGRSTINKSHDSSAIYLGNKNSDLDKILIQVLNSSMKDLLIIEDYCCDEIINEFYLTLQSIYLLRNMAKSKNIDLSHIDYDREVVKKLYYFKGSM